MLQRVERFCREHALFHPGDGIVVACSGGVDSMALVQMLLDGREALGIRLCVAHFEHGIRGEDSLEDARFVEGWCRERGLMFRRGSASVPAAAKERNLSMETAARELRYGFLEELRRELGFDAIATAHHADDQAETVLMRILRGSGTDGLAAMLPRQGHIVRPLLHLRKEELAAFCAARGIHARHDATNDLAECTRNRIRLKLLPQLRRDYNPKLPEALCRLAELASEQRAYITGEAARVFPEAARRRSGWELSQRVFGAQPKALQRALLRHFLGRAGVGLQDMGYRHLDALRNLMLQGETGSREELPGGWMAELFYGWMRVFRWDAEEMPTDLPVYTVPAPGNISLPEYGIRLKTQFLQGKPPAGIGAEEYCCDYGSLPGPLMVRPRRPGDVIFLAVGRKSLKKLLMESRIPRRERWKLPLLVSGNAVLWIPGIRRSSLYAAGESTKQILYLKIEQMKGKEQSHDEG